MGQLRKRGSTWWVRYYRNGKRYEESARTDKKGKAETLLRLREGDIAKGLNITPAHGRFTFDEAAADLVTEYRVNGRRSLHDLERRITKHLLPYFTGRRVASLTTADVRAYIAHRQAQGIVAVRGPRQGQRVGDVSNAEINRELTALKRVLSLALQAEKVLRRPHVPMLQEDNVRRGFLELEQITAVIAKLPPALQPVIEFAYLTGWRLTAEVLPLEWRQVDFMAGEVRLDPGTTKNRDGRTFPLTDDLRALLERQRADRDRLLKAGHVVPWVFFRLVSKGRGGVKMPKRIVSLGKAWQAACRAAGCPGRIPHDLRRSAIRNMVRRGVPERVAMQLSGHKTRSVFERYNIVSPGDLTSAAAQLAGLMGTKWGQSALTGTGRSS